MITDVPVDDWLPLDGDPTTPMRALDDTTAVLPRIDDWPRIDPDPPLIDGDWRLIAWSDPATPLLHAVLEGLRQLT